VSNLLLITDVARLRKIFSRLTEDKNIRLRIVNNLEKGGEELVLEKPDVVFVQTHLSGLSADILLMHLKKQLGRKRSRFVLLASPGQTSETILKPYQGWLDTSKEDALLLTELQHLLAKLLNKPKKSEESAPAEPVSSAEFKTEPVSAAESFALLNKSPVSEPVPEPVAPDLPNDELQLPAVPAPPPNPNHLWRSRGLPTLPASGYRSIPNSAAPLIMRSAARPNPKLSNRQRLPHPVTGMTKT